MDASVFFFHAVRDGSVPASCGYSRWFALLQLAASLGRSSVKWRVGAPGGKQVSFSMADTEIQPGGGKTLHTY